MLPGILQVLVGMRDTQRETLDEVKGLKEEIAEIKELVSALASGRPGLHA